MTLRVYHCSARCDDTDHPADRAGDVVFAGRGGLWCHACAGRENAPIHCNSASGPQPALQFRPLHAAMAWCGQLAGTSGRPRGDQRKGTSLPSLWPARASVTGVSPRANENDVNRAVADRSILNAISLSRRMLAGDVVRRTHTKHDQCMRVGRSEAGKLDLPRSQAGTPDLHSCRYRRRELSRDPRPDKEPVSSRWISEASVKTRRPHPSTRWSAQNNKTSLIRGASVNFLEKA